MAQALFSGFSRKPPPTVGQGLCLPPGYSSALPMQLFHSAKLQGESASSASQGGRAAAAWMCPMGMTSSPSARGCCKQLLFLSQKARAKRRASRCLSELLWWREGHRSIYAGWPKPSDQGGATGALIRQKEKLFSF